MARIPPPGDDGATTLDYLGVVGLAAAIVLVVVSLTTGTSVKIAGGISKAVCSVVSVATGQACETTVADPVFEPESCTLAEHDAEGSVGATAFSVHVEGKLAYTKAHVIGAGPDGKDWAITLIAGGKLGAQLGTPGAHASAGDAEAGAEAKIGIGAEGEAGDTYYFASQQEAQDFVDHVKHHLEDQAEDTVFPVKAGWDWITGRGDHFHMPRPDATYYQGGGYVSVDGSAGAGPGKVSGEGAASVVLGYSKNNTSGDKTYYLKVSAEGSVSGAAPGVNASAGAGLDGVLKVVVDQDNKPVSMELEGSAEVSGGFSLGAEADKGFSGLLKAVKSASVDSATRGGVKAQFGATLDLRDPENLAAYADVVASLGLSSYVPSQAEGGHGARGSAAVKELYDAFDRSGKISFATYATATQDDTGSADLNVGLSFGVNGGLKFTDESLVNLLYRIPDVGFVPSHKCVGSGQ